MAQTVKTACNAGAQVDPWIGRSPGEGIVAHSVFLAGESVNRGAWRPIVHRSCKLSNKIE